MRKSVLFITGTRADFGKLKHLIRIVENDFDVHIFVTGMHLLSIFGSTYLEVEKAGFNITWANEFDKDIWETFEKNFPNTNLDRRSIVDVLSDDIPDCDGIIGGLVNILLLLLDSTLFIEQPFNIINAINKNLIYILLHHNLKKAKIKTVFFMCWDFI